MKQKHLIWRLESLRQFENPKLHLEQYPTSAELTAEILRAVEAESGIEGCRIGDFGCGPGILMIGAALLGAKQCVGYELDEEVTAICRENIVEAEVEDQCEVITRDILAPDAFEKEEPFDLVLMNPPFGTKNNEGTDLRFVRTALETIKPDGSVYSLHKTSTRSGIQRRAQTWESVATVVAELRWELPRTYKHQRKETLDIAVDLIRFRKS
ncbi:MTS domain-containing protein [Aphelenchoides besseyi]|nr:MTS domain-containing protein [Aphelenchoides besseyi]